MDPDMVRQQEEAEAAARLRALQPPSLTPPPADLEAPLLPEPALRFVSQPEFVRAPQAELEYMSQPTGLAAPSFSAHSETESDAHSGAPACFRVEATSPQVTRVSAAAAQPAMHRSALDCAQLSSASGQAVQLPQAVAPSLTMPPQSAAEHQPAGHVIGASQIPSTSPQAEPDLTVQPSPLTQGYDAAASECCTPRSAPEPATQLHRAPMSAAERPATAVQNAVRPHPTSQAPEWPTRRIGGWSAALYCTVFAAAGIAGSLLVAPKLQLTAPQGAAIGTAAGFALGWLSAAARLKSQGASTAVAFRAPLLPTAFVLLVELCALYFTSSTPTDIPVESQTFFAEVAGAGGLLAFILAWIGIHAGVRNK